MRQHVGSLLNGEVNARGVGLVAASEGNHGGTALALVGVDSELDVGGVGRIRRDSGHRTLDNGHVLIANPVAVVGQTRSQVTLERQLHGQVAAFLGDFRSLRR